MTLGFDDNSLNLMNKFNTDFFRPTQIELEQGAFFAFFQGKILLKNREPEALVYADLSANMVTGNEVIPVAKFQNQLYFAVELDEIPLHLEARSLWAYLSAQPFFDLAGRAMQLVSWRATHRFCGSCGASTESSKTELSLICNNCQQTVYPRLSPCVIMAVCRGPELLLAQRPGSTHSMYTVLAGFVEPGESAERAVEREVWEEAGINVTDIRYYSSQPWPFPGQLMLGYFAEYQGGELNPDPTELQNAGWFDFRELPDHPPVSTISGRLIEQACIHLSAIYS